MIKNWNGKTKPWDSSEGRLLYQEWKSLKTSPEQRESVRSWLLENPKIDDYGFKMWEDMLFGAPIGGVSLSSTHLELKKERRKFDMLMLILSNYFMKKLRINKFVKQILIFKTHLFVNQIVFCLV